MKRLLCFAFVFLALVLWGCGGGSGSGGSTRKGSVGFTVKWPTPGRLIPYDCGVIVATLTDSNNQVIGTPQTINRPAQGVTSTSVTFVNVPTGVVTLTAVAYPTGYPNGAGTTVAQAIGAQQGTVTAGQTTPITVTMADTIVGITILNAAGGSPGGNLNTGQTQQLAWNAYDSSNETVMVSPNTIQWGIPVGSQYGSVSSTGLVTMLASGSTSESFEVDVEETESGKISPPVTFNYVATSSTLQNPKTAVIDASGTHLYTTVSSTTQGGIHVFDINASGQLSFVQEISAPGVNNVTNAAYSGIVITPDGTQLFAYAYNLNQIDEYSIKPDGTLAIEGEIGAPAEAETLAIDPSGHFLYAGGILSGLALDVYSIGAAPSGLSLATTYTTFNPGVPTNLFTIPGTNLMVGGAADSSNNKYLISFTVNADGTLNDVSQTFLSGFFPGPPYAVTPDGTQLYSLVEDIQIFGVAGNGLTTYDGLFTGVTSSADLPEAAINPGGQYMFVRAYDGFGSDTNSTSIATLSIGSGTLSTVTSATGLPNEKFGTVVVTPDGKFVYTTNPSDDSISEFTTNAFGTLTPLSPAKVAG
jgi:hypothetical protein